MDVSVNEGDLADLKEFLDQKADLYNRKEFINTDPVQIPHRYARPEDIEISAYLTSAIAWGRRSSIITSANRLLSRMPGGPYEFLLFAEAEDLENFNGFVHRTFNGTDCIYFLNALRRLYLEEGGLKTVFESGFRKHGHIAGAIHHFRLRFFRSGDPARTAKHVPDVGNNAGGKRINMFLRWLVRRDERGVDFGLWDGIPMNALHIPLDVHTGNVARKLGLLNRRQNDWKAVEELTCNLRHFDPDDPVRYDYALFGLGMFEGF